MTFDKLNRPLRDLRISVTDRCNFRCHYCMPAEVFGHNYQFLQREKILTFEEVTRVARLFARLGVKKIRLTGGEPLLRQDVEHLVAMLKGIDGINDLAMTTNAYFLKEKATVLKEAGLDRVTVSLDTLDDAKFKRLAGKHLTLERVLSGLDAASQAGFSPIKINTVLQKGVNDDEILDLVDFAKQRGDIIRFIEYMDVGNLNNWQPEDVISAEEVVARIAAEMPIEPIARNYQGEVANRYRYLDKNGEFGIIASVTRPFCGDCTRIRLSAAGELYTCLFASKGLNIKRPLRSGASDEEVMEICQSLWKHRPDRYSEERFARQPVKTSEEKVEMYHIGG